MLGLYTKINDLVVMDIIKKGSRKYYKLVCSFGHSVDVRTDSLKGSRVCGVCYKKNKRLSSLKRSPSMYGGYTKGQLKVVELLPRKPYEDARVITLCTCGNRQTMLVSNLISTTQSWSCGRCIPYHGYKGDTLHIYYEVGGYKSELMADKEDTHLVLKNSWTIHKETYNDYVRRSTGDRTFLHRILTNCPDDMFVDHINGNGLDNRKCNLRVVDKKENARNTKRNKNSSSGKMGVYFREDSSKWRVFINGDDGRENLGTYSNKEDAIRVREEAETFHGYHENHGRVTSKKGDN